MLNKRCGVLFSLCPFVSTLHLTYTEMILYCCKFSLLKQCFRLQIAQRYTNIYFEHYSQTAAFRIFSAFLLRYLRGTIIEKRNTVWNLLDAHKSNQLLIQFTVLSKNALVRLFYSIILLLTWKKVVVSHKHEQNSQSERQTDFNKVCSEWLSYTWFDLFLT